VVGEVARVYGNSRSTAEGLLRSVFEVYGRLEACQEGEEPEDSAFQESQRWSHAAQLGHTGSVREQPEKRPQRHLHPRLSYGRLRPLETQVVQRRPSSSACSRSGGCPQNKKLLPQPLSYRLKNLLASDHSSFSQRLIISGAPLMSSLHLTLPSGFPSTSLSHQLNDVQYSKLDWSSPGGIS
jgi:hypothetical protein